MTSSTSHSQYKYLLMRHAQSKHNIHKRKLQQQNPKYKSTQEFKKFKYNPEFIDPKEIYIPERIENVLEGLLKGSNIKVDVIVTSPLKRCLETAKVIRDKIMKQKNVNLQVIVEPYLASRVNCAWTLGTDLQQLIEEYKQHEFNFCNFQDIKHWGIKLMQLATSTNNSNSSHISPFSPQQLKSKKALPILLQHLKTSSLNQQSFQNFNKRIQILKQRLKQYSLLTSNQILIISHSCLMNALCTKQFDIDGKPKRKYKFKHWEVVRMETGFQLDQEDRGKLEKYYRDRKETKARI